MFLFASPHRCIISFCLPSSVHLLFCNKAWKLTWCHDLKKDKFLEDFGVRTPGDYLAKTFVDHTIQCLPKRRVLWILNFLCVWWLRSTVDMNSPVTHKFIMQVAMNSLCVLNMLFGFLKKKVPFCPFEKST